MNVHTCMWLKGQRELPMNHCKQWLIITTLKNQQGKWVKTRIKRWMYKWMLHIKSEGEKSAKKDKINRYFEKLDINVNSLHLFHKVAAITAWQCWSIMVFLELVTETVQLWKPLLHCPLGPSQSEKQKIETELLWKRS